MFYMLSGLDEEDFNLSPEEVITKYTGKRNALQKKKQKSVPYSSYGGGGNNNNVIFMLN